MIGTANEWKAQIKWNENKSEKKQRILKKKMYLCNTYITTSEKKKHGRNRQDKFPSYAQRVSQS